MDGVREEANTTREIPETLRFRLVAVARACEKDPGRKTILILRVGMGNRRNAMGKVFLIHFPRERK